MTVLESVPSRRLESAIEEYLRIVMIVRRVWAAAMLRQHAWKPFKAMGTETYLVGIDGYNIRCNGNSVEDVSRKDVTCTLGWIRTWFPAEFCN